MKLLVLVYWPAYVIHSTERHWSKSQVPHPQESFLDFPKITLGVFLYVPAVVLHTKHGFIISNDDACLPSLWYLPDYDGRTIFLLVNIMSHCLAHSRQLHVFLMSTCFFPIPLSNSQLSSVQLLSHVRLLMTPWTAAWQDFPVHHQLLEFTQTHVHEVDDASQPSYPLSAPSPPAFHLSQHQGLFQWVSSSHQVDKVLELQLQHQSFQFRTDLI